MILYGIPNCDSVKKARRYLAEQQIDYQFHDFKKDGIDEGLVHQFIEQFGWENVLNKRSTTYRQLSDEQKQNLTQENVSALLVAYPTLIKRPVLISPKTSLIGFNLTQYQSLNSH